MKTTNIILVVVTTFFSFSGFAKDYKQMSKDIVTNMYGKPGDIVAVNTFSNVNAFQVVLSNGAVSSESYLVEINEKHGEAGEGEEVANIKVTYEGNN